ncbi:LrgB family protein [Geobacter metallireducens RCH3]|uniref:Murein hydrolase-controlling membrane protein LrgB n=1 Tax=Geobacter metallireducens (strain ATCC 53774 / DSM 7210 / GS-15) TaxID=269799 RepID=Q39WD3_GEOMG|nr:LrgB family protein [Geobacter metallireducens]ABB31441.1 murein hydrolase-controlling membrane protein LrgB [Geobacter metallireducens GS-15]EHP88473.1 LrgB family protein [Geobacter metallireducens RCH3]
MSAEMQQVWVYLSTSPLLWLTLTLIAYQIGTWVFRRLDCPPLLNPVLTAIILLVVLLKVSGIDYQTYFRGAQFIHFLLGPATVALAIPLYREMEVIRKSFIPILITLAVGSVAAIISAVGIVWALGGETIILLSVAPKSVTTPIAMGISEQIGGLPSLTAVVVVLTGITGAVGGDFILNLLRIKDDNARGMALGVASHGIGTAHAIQKSRMAGAFSALAMALNGLFTALLLPVLVHLMQ